MPRILPYTLYQTINSPAAHPSYARVSSSEFVPQRMHTGTYCVQCNDVGNIVFNMSLHRDIFLMSCYYLRIGIVRRDFLDSCYGLYTIQLRILASQSINKYWHKYHGLPVTCGAEFQIPQYSAVTGKQCFTTCN